MISVLTGDIVHSQGLPSAERQRLQAFLEEAAGHTDLSASFEVFGGDSWQCLCQAPHAAVTLAIALRAYLAGKRGLDTRISIGIGSYESLRPEKISLSQGEAFVLSGRGLEQMDGDRRLSLRASDSLPYPVRELLGACVALLDAVTANWTAKQAQAVALAGQDRPQYELAKQFDPSISAQAFGKHLASAQWKLVSPALSSISRALRSALEDRP